MVKKMICVVAQDDNTAEQYRQQIENLIGDMLDVVGTSFESIETNKRRYMEKIFHSDLIVTSCEPIKHQLLALNEKTPKIIISAKTTLNSSYLTKLLQLPKNTSVLVVTCFSETANDTISLLKEYGYTDLNYIPYYPDAVDKESEKIFVAITVGVSQLVPAHISETIDLGIREIDISTIVHILRAMDMPVERADEISHSYIKGLISLSGEYKKMADKVIGLNTQLEAVISNSDDGIFAVDHDFVLIAVNATAIKIFGLPNEHYSGRDAREVFPSLDFDTSFESDVGDLDNIKGKEVLIHKRPVIINEKEYVWLYNIKLVSRVQKLEREVRIKTLQSGHVAQYRFEDIIGKSKAVLDTILTAKTFSRTDMTISIVGDSGTGKEMFAQSIHNHSERFSGPFVAVNFAALPESLVESELFGYEEGAFTGAKKGGKSGFFELAHHGTIFLDEIGDAPLSIQMKLLRVLEERKVIRIGSSKVVPFDIRVIVATNKKLRKLVDDGKFREDLYYRLHVLPLIIPNLRERSEDIFMLVKHFISENFYPIFEFPVEIMAFLQEYSWPGNIRQLENVVKFLGTKIQNGKVELEDLKRALWSDQRICSDFDSENDIPELFCLHGNREEYRAVLEVLRVAYFSGENLGRRTILRRVIQKNTSLTEARIRKILYVLNRMGYTLSGNTRQGTKITEKGIKLFSLLADSN